MTIIIFVAAYALMVRFYKYKVWVIWGSVVLLLLVGAVTLRQALDSINWNVIGIYVGMLFIAEALIASDVPDYVSTWVANKFRSALWTMLMLCLLSGLLSTFLENVAVVLIMAPIAFSIAKKLEISPIPMVIGIAISSNLQGVALLIGDPPSILLANFLGMDFNDFFLFNGRPGLFFAVQLGMFASLAVLYFFFRRYHWRVTEELRGVRIKSIIPLSILVLLIVTLVYVSTNHHDHLLPLGGVTMFFGALALLWLMKFKRQANRRIVNTVFEQDWYTAFFIVAVFILVESLVQTGVIIDIAKASVSLLGTSVALSFVFIVTLSVILSAFVDNIPYLVTMLPLIQSIGSEWGTTPYVLYFGLLIGASVGGNITPIGASANIAAVGLLKNKGYETSFWEFVKMGLPFTIVAVLVSAGFIWFIFG
ncbi:TPA: TRAP transporter large permease subunit [Candidatus Woesearchaeota archaeon]|nr:TRAP transporter large permease subunit [Candidatus Woesearchaeota archaeon]